MCMDCFQTMGSIEKQRADKLKINQICSNCSNHETTEDFSDVLCRCILDGLEKGNNSTCQKWSK